MEATNPDAFVSDTEPLREDSGASEDEASESRLLPPLTPEEEELTARLQAIADETGGKLTVFKKGMGWARRKLPKQQPSK